MKLSFATTTIVFLFLFKISLGKERCDADTLYILLKNDNSDFNQIQADVDSAYFYLYGFVRNNQPRDWLDSAGFLGFSIGIEKEEKGLCRSIACKEYLKNTMSSLYDLRDTLKHYILNREWRTREPVFNASELIRNKKIVLVIESNGVYHLHTVKYILGFNRSID